MKRAAAFYVLRPFIPMQRRFANGIILTLGLSVNGVFLMSEWEQRLLAMVVIVAIANLKNWRGLVLLMLMVCNYLATSVWYDLGLPNHATITAMANTAVVLYAVGVAKYKWEMVVAGIFMVSVLCSMAEILKSLTDPYLYALALELCNWAALLVIGSVGIMRWISYGGWMDQKYSSWALVRVARTAVWAEAKQHVERRK